MLCEVTTMKRTFSITRMLIASIGICACLLLTSPIVTSAKTTAVTTGSIKMVPFYWIVGIVGGSIAVTLTYVGWKKYKGEEKKKSDEDSDS
ncbi:hypothetical protein FH966_13115 [Lentibacillus cibarius]|uniref:Uncharacterized protein n=2 Tax=Lentibacillus cibarius TaxID=2583219 RepID=A0A549YN17_9BACI|nr:hypothetical protein FH966_13115 [Lentibacillus cibarius]